MTNILILTLAISYKKGKLFVSQKCLKSLELLKHLTLIIVLFNTSKATQTKHTFYISLCRRTQNDVTY